MDSSRQDGRQGTSGWNEPAPVEPKGPASRAEPPDILLSALAALLLVVAAVCVLAIVPTTWTLLLAVTTMVAGTLALAFVIRLELEQRERPR